jgi:uncharacterized protein YndB with AHSA1/START domain
MSLPSTASATIEIDAPPATVYDLVSDVTRMGEWSPECKRCDWRDEPGQVGSTFRGRNRSGLARWSTTARVLVADRPREFTFATNYRGKVATRWSYTLDGDDTTTLTETFEAVSQPLMIKLVERWFIRDRQEQLETGMAQTLAAIKVVAEREHARP